MYFEFYFEQLKYINNKLRNIKINTFALQLASRCSSHIDKSHVWLQYEDMFILVTQSIERPVVI